MMRRVPAITVKTEGWEIYVEIRVQGQVAPEFSPYVVAAVGGVEEVLDRELVPLIRSKVRNLGGGGMITVNEEVVMEESCKSVEDPKTGELVIDRSTCETELREVTRPVKVLDWIDQRDALEKLIGDAVIAEADHTGVDVRAIRIARADIPPELLVSRKREQLASQMRNTFAQERISQFERIARDHAAAEADQQAKLVEAEIDVKRSVQLKVALQNNGEGEEEKLKAIARGQKAQVDVLGEDRVMELRQYELAMERIFDFANAHPEVIAAALTNAHKFVPDRVITMGEGGGGLEGPMAILGDMLSPKAKSTDTQ